MSPIPTPVHPPIQGLDCPPEAVQGLKADGAHCLWLTDRGPVAWPMPAPRAARRFPSLVEINKDTWANRTRLAPIESKDRIFRIVLVNGEVIVLKDLGSWFTVQTGKAALQLNESSPVVVFQTAVFLHLMAKGIEELNELKHGLARRKGSR